MMHDDCKFDRAVFPRGPLPITRLVAALAALFMAQFAASAADKPVSYYKDLVPIFKRSCNGCHHPGKLKGELDLTTHAMITKGGEHCAIIKPGDPKNSNLLEEISGEEPSMPKEGDPLSKEEVALLERWISEGAKDDTPADKLNPFKISEPPVYEAPAVIASVIYSPDGSTLAVSG